MNPSEKNKKKHDVLNTIVSINSIAKSASHFAEKLVTFEKNNQTNIIWSKQVNLFLSAMDTIQAETAKIEIILNEIIDS